jgi:hypothetical protein
VRTTATLDEDYITPTFTAGVLPDRADVRDGQVRLVDLNGLIYATDARTHPAPHRPSLRQPRGRNLLAALAIEHGAGLCTLDTDCSRFPGLVTMRPQ